MALLYISAPHYSTLLVEVVFVVYAICATSMQIICNILLELTEYNVMHCWASCNLLMLSLTIMSVLSDGNQDWFTVVTLNYNFYCKIMFYGLDYYIF